MRAAEQLDGPLANGHRERADAVVTLNDVSVEFHNSRGVVRALDGVTMRVKAGDRIAIVGESGSGKSTIARLVLGLVRATTGAVSVLGEDWSTLKPRAARHLRADLGSVFQEPIESLNPTKRVETLIAEPLVLHQRDLMRRDRDELIDAALARVLLDPDIYRRRYPSELSGGEAQRVSMARALVLEPQLLVLDEPTSALDMLVQKQVLDVLSHVAAERQLAWIFITHDLAVAASLCEHVIVLHAGRIVEEGPTASVLMNPGQPYTQRLVEATLSLDFLAEPTPPIP